MTEALRKWSVEKLGHYGEHEAEFWIRAFCDEVEKRAKAMSSDSCRYDDALWGAFDNLKQELLGE